MRNFKHIFLTLLGLSFLSCIFISCRIGDGINLDNINCTLDKNSYSINEDIILSFSGYFEDDIGKGNLAIDFRIYKLENGERDKKTIPSFNIEDIGKLITLDNAYLNNAYKDDGEFSAYIFFNSTIESFSDKIIMNIQEAGNYQIDVIIGGSAYKYVYDSKKDFTIDFEVL